MDWYRQSTDEVIENLDTRFEGLTGEEAGERLVKYGLNELISPPTESRVIKFLKQFTSLLILVLIGAAIIAGLLGEYVDAVAILAIVLINAVIGFIQEERAERVLEALKKMSAPVAKVFRGGELTSVPASTLVVGDVISLDAGDNVPADCRVIDSRLLRIDEAPLTGESQPVDKLTGSLESTLPLADRINMTFSATRVVYGRGRAVVVSTGMKTEIGKIARLLEEVKREPTPLQKRLAEFGRLLVYAAGGVCLLIFLLGILRGFDTLEMFLTAVSLAVAAIPEGLPAVVTIVLALGVQRMARRNGLVRKLPSVETLGSASVIASDKTGTITQNQMTVRRLYLATGESLEVTGSGYEPKGDFLIDSKKVELSREPVFKRAMQVSRLCNSAELKGEEGGEWFVIGDPTEGALLTLAQKSGMDFEELKGSLTFVAEIPFDATRKMMTTIYKDRENIYHAFIKGAPDMVLPRSSLLYSEDELTQMDEEKRSALVEVNEKFAGGALRVLALAYRRSESPFDITDIDSVESDLVFVALTGMIDPPRPEVIEAVVTTKAAGITPIMITGDHKITAMAIAREIGILGENELAITGEELDAYSEAQFMKLLPLIKVYARVSPAHKIKIVRAWKARGDIIAMTGDGVNDAPALKEADIGIAMGITGTDVTKEAADMVLMDDNFASIVSAVEEGRGIFDNIRRVVHFLLSCNIGEIILLLVAALMGLPLPLLPVQILWMNLVTDGLPALGLAMEPIDPKVMKEKPRKITEGIVTKELIRVMAIQGLFMAMCTFLVYALELYWFESGLDKARTMAFLVIVFCQKFHIFNCKNIWESVLNRRIFSNKLLNLSVVFIIATQVAIIYVPALRTVFKVVAIGGMDWVLVLVVSVQPLIWMEVAKAVRRRARV